MARAEGNPFFAGRDRPVDQGARPLAERCRGRRACARDAARHDPGDHPGATRSPGARGATHPAARRGVRAGVPRGGDRRARTGSGVRLRLAGGSARPEGPHPALGRRQLRLSPHPDPGGGLSDAASRGAGGAARGGRPPPRRTCRRARGCARRADRLSLSRGRHPHERDEGCARSTRSRSGERPSAGSSARPTSRRPAPRPPRPPGTCARPSSWRRPSDLPELQERLGDVSGGDAGAEAYRVALRLCRDLGRPADQELRILGSLLIRYMRFQGTVGNRPSAEEIQRLRADGRALLGRARDERAIASFLIADGFYPFWRGAQTTAAGHRRGRGEHGARPGDRRPPRRPPAQERRPRRPDLQRAGAWGVGAGPPVLPGAPRLRGPPRSARATRRPHHGGVGVGPAGRPRPGGPRDGLGSGLVSFRAGALVGAPLRRLASVRPDAPRTMGRGACRRRACAQDLGRGGTHPGGILRSRLHRRPGRGPGASRQPAGRPVPRGARRDPEALCGGLPLRAIAPVRPRRPRRARGGGHRGLRHDSARSAAARRAHALPVRRPRPAARPRNDPADRGGGHRRRPEAARGPGAPGPRHRDARHRGAHARPGDLRGGAGGAIRRTGPQRAGASHRRSDGEFEAGLHVLETLGDVDQLARMERARRESGPAHG